jgi:DNA-binding HxlR family transcriptional regulator
MNPEQILKILPKQGDLYNRLCPTRSIIDHVSSVWGTAVLKALQEHKTMRFAELRRQIEGISEKMLAQTLRNFERDGLVNRISYPVKPPKVEYSLTPLGRDCAGHVTAFCSFIEDQMYTIVKNQFKYDETPTEASWQKSS